MNISLSDNNKSQNKSEKINLPKNVGSLKTKDPKNKQVFCTNLEIF